MAEYDLESAAALLERFPAALDGLLRGLPESWTLARERDGTWCVLEIVGHLIDSERQNWIARTKVILEAGEAETFAPFDRGGHQRRTDGKTMAELLDTFAAVRAANLAELRGMNLQAEDLAKCGRHPAFGMVRLSELLATWVAHDMTHLHQLSRVLAKEYGGAVGPWRAYLGVLRCEAHGD